MRARGRHRSPGPPRLARNMIRSPGQLRAGDGIWCRARAGSWVYKVALAAASPDGHDDGEPARLSVPAADPADWARAGLAADYVNWPATEVRPDSRH